MSVVSSGMSKSSCRELSMKLTKRDFSERMLAAVAMTLMFMYRVVLEHISAERNQL